MSPPGAPNQNHIITINNVDGQVVMELKHNNEELLIHPDGSLESNSHYKYITLVDGSVWSPQTKLAIGICDICRRPSFLKKRTHGLVNLARARLCKCGALCCPKHRVLLGNRWYCPRCAKKYKLKNFLRLLFFKRIEE